MMYRQLFLISFLLVTWGVMCSAQVVHFGTCANVQTMQYFNIEEFLGNWYEIERFPTWYEESGDCAFKRIQYCERRVEIEHVYVKHGIQFVLHLNTTYVPGDPAVFLVQESNIGKIDPVILCDLTLYDAICDLTDLTVPLYPMGIPLTVLTTDYRNFAIVYGCRHTDVLGIKFISAWILSRRPTLQDEYLRRAYQVINSLPSVSSIYLEKVNQTAVRCQAHWTAYVKTVNFDEVYG